MNLKEKLKENPDLWNIFNSSNEYQIENVDKHKRVLFNHLTNNDITYPKVSEFLLKECFKPTFPEEKKFAIMLSHDIDDIYVPLIHFFASIALFPKHKSLKGITDLLKGIISKKNSPYLNLKEILELEEKYEAKSTFFFLATEEDPIRFRYKIEDLEDSLHTIIDKKCEVGFHTGYYSYDNLEKIKEEKNRIEKIINRKVIGVRNHFMRFHLPHTWKNLAESNFKYDSTFGYPNMIGFRNGMCHPFRPYDLDQNKFIDITEIPLNIMDTTLFNYMKLDLKESWEKIKQMIDITERNQGVLSILWHNTTFKNPVLKGWEKMYEKILSYSQEKNAWLSSGEEIWKQFSKSM